MRVLLIPWPTLWHRFAHPDGDDNRLAWTRCGIRFAWSGKLPGPLPRLPDCEGCAS